MVDAEIQIPRIVGINRAEADFRIYLAEADVGKGAYGMAALHIGEIAADYHIGAAI